MPSPSYVKHATAKLSEVAATTLAKCSSTAIHSSILPLKDNENDVPPIVTRSVGPCRSVFILDPYLNKGDAWNGFSDRLQSWSTNESINAVFITCPDKKDIIGDDGSVLPLSAQYVMPESISKSADFFSTQTNIHQRHILLGLDPLATSESCYHDVLDGISNIAKTMINETRKTPIITCPDGFVTDGGLAFLLGQYVLATPNTSFRIDHPKHGLALDPCGMSYVLNRVGYDFEQKHAKEYASTIAKIMALTGFEADGKDMVATGLATNYMDNEENTSLIEIALSNILPYTDQGLLPKPTRTQAQWIQEYNAYIASGGVVPEDIPNRRFRNTAVHNLMDAVSVGQAGRNDFLSAPPSLAANKDPSHENIDFFLESDVGCDLIDVAATFHPIFEESTVHGIMERLREITTKKEGEMDPDVIHLASKFLNGMKCRSPLSLMVVHKLLKLGNEPDASMSDCIERESLVQKNMLLQEDFANWFKLRSSDSCDTNSTPWKHVSVSDITGDEVEELFQES